MDTQCSEPVRVRSGGKLRLVRCRRCPPCLRAAQRYWAAAAASQIRASDAKGCRSWFGTCTFRPEIQAELLTRALTTCASELVDWQALTTVERFGRLQHEALDEVQKYWKRLRKVGLSFKYMATFEEDSEGRPHIHCLIHESDPDRPLRKRELDAGWGLGFTNFRLLTVTSNDAAYGAIAYVTKSLATQRYFRMCASVDYRPERPSKSKRPHHNYEGLHLK